MLALAQHAPEVAHAAEGGGIREIAWLIPVLPLSAFFLIIFFGKRTPGKGAGIGIAATGTAFLLGMLSFFEAIRDGGIVERSIHWISFGPVDLELGIRVDSLASMMFVVV